MNGIRRLLAVVALSTMVLAVPQAASADDQRRIALAFDIRFTGATPSGTGQLIVGNGSFSVSGAIAGNGHTAVILTVTPSGPASTGQALEKGEQTFTTPTGSFKADFRGRVHDADTLHPYGKGIAEFTGLTGEFSGLSGKGAFEVDVDFTLPPGGGATGTYGARVILQ